MATNVFGVAVTTLLQLIRGKIRQGLKVRLADSSSSPRPPALSLSLPLFKRPPFPPLSRFFPHLFVFPLCLFNQTPDSVFITSTNLSALSSNSLSNRLGSSRVSTMCKRKQWRNEITGSLSFLFNLRNRDVLLPSFRVIRCNPPRASSPPFYFSSSRTQFQQFM